MIKIQIMEYRDGWHLYVWDAARQLWDEGGLDPEDIIQMVKKVVNKEDEEALALSNQLNKPTNDLYDSYRQDDAPPDFNGHNK